MTPMISKVYTRTGDTGKTSLAYALGKFLGNDAVMVPVQPSWKDRTDLLGYYNEFTDSYTETELLFKLYEAGQNDACPCFSLFRRTCLLKLSAV